MKRWLMLTAGLLATTLSGCANGPGQYYFPRPPQAQLPVTPASLPTAEQIVTHLNQNASGIQALEAQDVSIDVNQGGLQEWRVYGMLYFQKPRNFRLTAEALRQSEADFGSNDREFWYWLKRNDPPALFHCSYEELPRVRAFPLPFHPDWIADGLALNELDPRASYQVVRQGTQALALVTTAATPQGEPLQKIITVATAGPNAGRVVSQRLRTPQGQEIWTVDIEDYQNLHGYLVPRRVRLRAPQEKLELRLKLERAAVNPPMLLNGQAGNTFARPASRQEVDLAKYTPRTP